MLTIAFFAFLIYVFLSVIFEVFRSKGVRLWAILSLVFLWNYASYSDRGIDGIIINVPFGCLLLWFVYMDLRR
jgi:hypothetical protein